MNVVTTLGRHLGVSLFGLLFAMSQVAVAQESPPDWKLSINYFGETFAHPGLTIDVSRPLVQSDFVSLPLKLEMGMFFHPKDSSSFFFNVQTGARLELKGGFHAELLGGFGYMHVLLTDPTYQIVDGKARPLVHWGFPELMLPVSFGLGWNLEKALLAPVDLGVRFGAYGEYPVNTLLIVKPFVEVTSSFVLFDLQIPQGMNKD